MYARGDEKPRPGYFIVLFLFTMKMASTQTTKKSGSSMSGMPNVLVMDGITWRSKGGKTEE